MKMVKSWKIGNELKRGREIVEDGEETVEINRNIKKIVNTSVLQS